jgi:uncharacterized protein YijF (DUF1287 family)
VINHPDAKKYQHWTNETLPSAVEDWIAGAAEQPGSWWPHWAKWLRAQSGPLVPARNPAKGKLKPLEDAPGSYVQVKSNPDAYAPATESWRSRDSVRPRLARFMAELAAMLTLDRRTALGMILSAPALGAAAPLRALPRDGFSLARAARAQIGVTKAYDASYRAISYPLGDVLRTTGVCADVLVRAARDAWKVDLQERVHEDMVRAFDAYPSREAWGLRAPDRNIDHRRVLNLETYLTRQGALLRRSPPKTAGDEFDDPRPGDILTWKVWGGRPHLGVVADGPDRIRVVHNIGFGAKEEPLWMFKLHRAAAHYRWRA